MDKDGIAGAAKQAKGSMKQVAVRQQATKNSARTGRRTRWRAKVHNTAGGLKDSVRNALDK